MICAQARQVGAEIYWGMRPGRFRTIREKPLGGIKS